jgi:hypothetical protein
MKSNPTRAANGQSSSALCCLTTRQKTAYGKIAIQVVRHLAEALDFQALGLLPYHNFRSESEQAALREDVWA